MPRHVNIQNLAERIRAIEDRHTAGPSASTGCIDRAQKDLGLPTGWAEIDAAIGGGLPPGLHEWFAACHSPRTWHGLPAHEFTGRMPVPRQPWTPPLCILSHLAWQALDHAAAGQWILWIGRSCHPYPRVLVRSRGQDRRLLDHSLFVSPGNPQSAIRNPQSEGVPRRKRGIEGLRDPGTEGCLWAMDLALRSPTVAAIIGDGSGFDMAATRRLQLLARSNAKWIFTARPPEQQKQLSAAQTRWLVSRLLISDLRPLTSDLRSLTSDPRSPPLPLSPSPTLCRPPLPLRWTIELLRCKGVRPVGDPKWLLEWNRAQSAVHLSAPLADLAGQPASPASPARVRA